MKRSMMQCYVKNSGDAVRVYQQAFGAVLGYNVPAVDSENFYHAELDIEGHVLAVAENPGAPETGSIMQFCLHYGEGGEDKVRKAYEVLQEGATIGYPLGPCEFSPLMSDITDRFGVRWCLFV